MNCDQIKNRIDQLVFENNEQLALEVSQHIESCASCLTYFEESGLARKKIELLRKEPQLSHPEKLSAGIMEAIEGVEQIPVSNRGKLKLIHVIQKAFAAASVILMIIFGIEQFMVIDKLLQLEDEVSSLSIRPVNSRIQDLIKFNLGVPAETLANLFTHDFNGSHSILLKTGITRLRLSSIAINQNIYQSRFINQDAGFNRFINSNPKRLRN